MDKALNNQVINTVEDTYIKELNNRYNALLGVTCQDLLEHLIDRYGNINM